MVCRFYLTATEDRGSECERDRENTCELQSPTRVFLLSPSLLPRRLSSLTQSHTLTHSQTIIPLLLRRHLNITSCSSAVQKYYEHTILLSLDETSWVRSAW